MFRTEVFIGHGGRGRNSEALPDTSGNSGKAPSTASSTASDTRQSGAQNRVLTGNRAISGSVPHAPHGPEANAGVSRAVGSTGCTCPLPVIRQTRGGVGRVHLHEMDLIANLDRELQRHHRQVRRLLNPENVPGQLKATACDRLNTHIP